MREEFTKLGLLSPDFEEISLDKLNIIKEDDYYEMSKEEQDEANPYRVVLPHRIKAVDIKQAFHNGVDSTKLIIKDSLYSYKKSGLEYSVFDPKNPTTKKVSTFDTKEEEMPKMSDMLLLDAVEKLESGMELSAEEVNVIDSRWNEVAADIKMSKEEFDAKYKDGNADGGVKKSTAMSDNKNETTTGTTTGGSKPRRRSAEEIIGVDRIAKVKAGREKVRSAAQQKFFKFNQDFGSHICFITKEDAKITLQTKVEYPLGEDDQPKFKSTVKPEIKDMVLAKRAGQPVNGSIPKRSEIYQSHLRLGFKQAAPSKAIASIIAIPTISFNVDDSKLEDDATLDALDYNNTSVTYTTLLTTDLTRVITDYFAGRITEHKDVVAAYSAKDTEYPAGSADSNFYLETKRVEKYDAKDYINGKLSENAVAVDWDIKVTMKHSYRRRLLNPLNYIALTRFKTMTTDSLTEAEADALNKWYIAPLLDVRKDKATKYEELAGSDKLYITQNPDGTVVSKIFTANINESVLDTDQFKCKSWYNDQNVELAIPMKYTPDNKKRYTFVKESLLDENSEYTLAAYPTLKNILGDYLSVTLLKEISDEHATVQRQLKDAENDPYGAVAEDAVAIIEVFEKSNQGTALGIGSKKDAIKRMQKFTSAQ